MRPINYPDNYLVIEFANACSLACTHCIQSLKTEFSHYDKFGYFNPDMFASLLEDLAASGIKFQNFICFWLGEPLLHPRFIDLYRMVLEHNRVHKTFWNIEVNTNATHLKPEITDMVLSHPDVRQKWHFTIDAVSRQTFALVKGRDLLDPVRAAVRHFVEEKARRKARYPRTVFQFIVRAQNLHEATPFAQEWTNFLRARGLSCHEVGYGVPGDDENYVFFRQYDVLDFAEAEPALQNYHAVLKQRGLLHEAPAPKLASLKSKFLTVLNGGVQPRPRQICSGMWKSPTINWDGRVTVCTRDSSFNLIAGDLRKERFSEIWWRNERLELQRQAMIQGAYHHIPFCEGCIIPRSHNYTGITQAELEDYRRHQHESRTLPLAATG